MPKRRTRRAKLSMKRKASRRRRDQCQASGLTFHACWFYTRLWEQIVQRAEALGLHRAMVLRAAIEVGVRYLTTSEILRVTHSYQGLIGLPAAPHYPGERFQALPEALPRAREQLRLQREARRGQPCPDVAPPQSEPVPAAS